MRLPGWSHRIHERTPAEHAQALADLSDKDKIIDGLLQTADDLVSELRMSLGNVSAALRDSPGEADDDSG
jgi:hypothetical protein